MSTSTESTSPGLVSSTTLRVDLADERVRVHLATDAPDAAPQVRPMLLASDGTSARVALVPDGALLLADDHVRISIEVGPGAALEIVEPGGTVAYDMDGRWAQWDVAITLGSAATLVWHGEPFVISGGAGVRRTTTVVVGDNAGLALREAVVLGRHGEEPGRLVQQTVCTDPAGAPLLVEGLDVDATSCGPLLGGLPVMVSVLVLGAPRCDVAGQTVCYDLESGGHLYRACAGSVHEAVDAALWDQVARAIRSRTSNSMPTASAR